MKFQNGDCVIVTELYFPRVKMGTCGIIIQGTDVLGEPIYAVKVGNFTTVFRESMLDFANKNRRIC